MYSVIPYPHAGHSSNNLHALLSTKTGTKTPGIQTITQNLSIHTQSLSVPLLEGKRTHYGHPQPCQSAGPALPALHTSLPAPAPVSHHNAHVTLCHCNSLIYFVTTPTGPCCQPDAPLSFSKACHLFRCTM